MDKNTDLTEWLAATLGHTPDDIAIFERALAHPSTGEENYQRLEFLGDRVLGLTIASSLYTLHDADAEGLLNGRLASLVSGATCAKIGREIGVAPHIALGKQARDDGAGDSDKVLGDVVEALIGALYLDGGFGPASDFIRRAWQARVEGMASAPQHPKSALQEWAAAHQSLPPVYSLARQSGPDHNARFTIKVEIPGKASAEATGASKQEAETAAAKALLEMLV